MPRYVSRGVFAGAVVAALAAGAWRIWQSSQHGQSADDADQLAVGEQAVAASSPPVRISPQARQNLRLVTQPLKPTTYWRVVEFPGVLVDRPGVTDRGVVAPIAGVVTKIHAYPGDAIEPDAPLFTLRLNSESLYNSQLELFKATQETGISQRELARISGAAQSGAVAQTRVIDIQNDIQRLDATVRAYQQDLKARGLPEDRIAAAAAGEFVTEIVVRAPDGREQRATESAPHAAPEDDDATPFSFELHSLAVELGQQVAAGEILCHLGDHRQLLIEGRGFKDDMPLVQEAVRNGWEVEVEFDLPSDDRWPPLPERIPIHHMANVVDPETRTFGFYLELTNQWQTYTRDGATRLLWRFRPGSQLRLRVPVEKSKNVLVVPQQAVVREGAEAYVFRQNGDYFDRRPVHVLYEDRVNVVLANDGSIRTGFFIAQNAAASLNRVLKSQSSSGAPAGMHVHADGTVHAAH